MSKESANQTNDAFLSSMTFATVAACTCDECDTNNGGAIPPDILRAVRAYQNKRQSAQATSPFDKRSKVNIVQRRELMERFGGVSLWKLTLPVGNGDPIVEYRNSHRIVFVKRLPSNSTVFSIGRGIIGSAAEEVDRKRVPWEQGSAYYLPCSKGLACGWIHKQQRDLHREAVEDRDQGDMDVTLYIFKASPEAICDDVSEDAPSWVKFMTQLFLRLCGSNQTKCDSNNGETDQLAKTDFNGDVSRGILLSADDSINISDIVEQIVGTNPTSTHHST